MKLRNLKGTIRKMPHLRIAFDTPAGQMLTSLIKSDMLTTLDTMYGADGGVETGLTITPVGLVALEGAPTPSITGSATLAWQPTVAAAAHKLTKLAGRPLLTNEGKMLLAGEILDIAADLARIAGGATTESEEIDIVDSFDDELEGLLS